MTLHACIICGDSGFSYLENPILFCYTCKGNLNEEQMIRIQKALQGADLTEFRAELRQAKLWSDNTIRAKDLEIKELVKRIGALTNSRDGNVKLLKRAQELGLEAMVENHKVRKLVGSMRNGIGEWFKNNRKYDNTPTMSTYESYQSTDEVLKEIEGLFK